MNMHTITKTTGDLSLLNKNDYQKNSWKNL